MEESPILKLMRHNEAHDCVCITAYRSNMERDDAGIQKRNAQVSNQAANNALGALLRKMGYGITKVVGKYPDEGGQYDERDGGWFAANVNDDLDFIGSCADLAEADEQDAILVIPKGCFSPGRGCYFYGTKNDPDAWIRYHERKTVGGISINGDSTFEVSIGWKMYSFSIVDESDEDEFWDPSSMYGAQARHAYIKNHYGQDFFNVKGTQ